MVMIRLTSSMMIVMSRMSMIIMPTIWIVMTKMAISRMAINSKLAHEQDGYAHHDHEQHSLEQDGPDQVA